MSLKICGHNFFPSVYYLVRVSIRVDDFLAAILHQDVCIHQTIRRQTQVLFPYKITVRS